MSPAEIIRSVLPYIDLTLGENARLRVVSETQSNLISSLLPKYNPVEYVRTTKNMLCFSDSPRMKKWNWILATCFKSSEKWKGAIEDIPDYRVSWNNCCNLKRILFPASLLMAVPHAWKQLTPDLFLLLQPFLFLCYIYSWVANEYGNIHQSRDSEIENI